jgi:hypothetical protein
VGGARARRFMEVAKGSVKTSEMPDIDPVSTHLGQKAPEASIFEKWATDLGYTIQKRSKTPISVKWWLTKDSERFLMVYSFTIKFNPKDIPAWGEDTTFLPEVVARHFYGTYIRRFVKGSSLEELCSPAAFSMGVPLEFSPMSYFERVNSMKRAGAKLGGFIKAALSSFERSDFVTDDIDSDSLILGQNGNVYFADIVRVFRKKDYPRDVKESPVEDFYNRLVELAFHLITNRWYKDVKDVVELPSYERFTQENKFWWRKRGDKNFFVM